MGASTSASARHGRGVTAPRVMAEMNVTPLVDVMLVLLIVFMVAAPLMTTSLPIELPRVTSADPSQVDASQGIVVVDVTRGGEVYLDQAAVTGGASGLASALADHPRIAEGGALHVRADRGAAYGVVADVVAVARAAGVRSVNLVVESDAGSGQGR